MFKSCGPPGPRILNVGTEIMSKATISLGTQAYDVIENMIVTLKLEPGYVFSEADLSKDIGIGRTPMREALQRLAINPRDAVGNMPAVRGNRTAADFANLVEVFGCDFAFAALWHGSVLTE